MYPPYIALVTNAKLRSGNKEWENQLLPLLVTREFREANNVKFVFLSALRVKRTKKRD